jgi:hypothetical protein
LTSQPIKYMFLKVKGRERKILRPSRSVAGN